MRPEFDIHRRRSLILCPMKCKKCGAESRNGWIVYGPPYGFPGRIPTQRFVCKQCFSTKECVNTYFCELYMTRPVPPPTPCPAKPIASTRSGKVYEGPDTYDDSTSIRGTVSARTCPTCGHHEIGVRREKGSEFVTLQPGTKIVGYLIPPEK